MTGLALPLLKEPGLTLYALTCKLTKELLEATKGMVDQYDKPVTMRLEVQKRCWQLENWCLGKPK